MTYRTLLVSLNDAERAQEVINAAKIIAIKNEAHLIGLYTIPAIEYPPMIAAVEIPTEIIETQRKFYKDEAENICHLFTESTQSENLSTEWRSVESVSPYIHETVIEHGRMADLIVTGQGRSDIPNKNLIALPEYLVMEAGRPILIVPSKGTFSHIGDYPLIAWNASKESSRALFDALPLLKMSKDVKVLQIDPAQSTIESIEISGSEIATSLARHGVPAEADHRMSNGKNVAAVLLSEVSKTSSDIIIMGGYGRSRFREYIFGGVTRHMLDQMTVPVLMSH